MRAAMVALMVAWFPATAAGENVGTDPSPLCHTIATFEQPIGHSMDSLVKRHVVSYCGHFLEPQLHIRETIINPRTNQSLGSDRGDYYPLPKKEEVPDPPTVAPGIQPVPTP